MFTQSHVLFKQFLPKKRERFRCKAHQTINLQSLSQQLQKQSNNIRLNLFKQTVLSKKPALLSKPFSEHYYSTKKMLLLKPRAYINKSSSAVITQLSTRSQVEFVDDNMWNHLVQNKTKKLQDSAKEMPRKTNRPHLATIFKSSKQVIADSRQSQVDFRRCNLIALRKMVRSQSEQRKKQQSMRFDLIHAKKVQQKSTSSKNELYSNFFRRQQKSDLKLKIFSRIVQNKNESEKLNMKELKKVQRRGNPQKNFNLSAVPEDLKASKVIFRRKNSLKREIIDKIRRERAENCKKGQKQSSLQDSNCVSSYLTQGDYTLPICNFSIHLKNRFKTQQSEQTFVDRQASNQTQKCHIKKTQWDDFMGPPIDPW